MIIELIAKGPTGSRKTTLLSFIKAALEPTSFRVIDGPSLLDVNAEVLYIDRTIDEPVPEVAPALYTSPAPPNPYETPMVGSPGVGDIVSALATVSEQIHWQSVFMQRELGGKYVIPQSGDYPNPDRATSGT